MAVEDAARRRVFEHPARGIARRENPAGTRLPEREMSEAYGVRRMSIREALPLREQAAVMRRGRATFSARAQSLPAIDHVNHVRTVLEKLPVDLAAATVGSTAFDALIEGTKKTASLPTTAALGGREQFHEQLASLTGNEHLCRVLGEINLRNPGSPPGCFGELEQARLARAAARAVLRTDPGKLPRRVKIFNALPHREQPVQRSQTTEGRI